jgi:hypothetical protein
MDWRARALAGHAGRLLLVVLPLLIWIDYLRSIYRSLATASTGRGNLGSPLIAYVATWSRTIEELLAGLTRGPLLDLAALISLTIAVAVLLWRREWKTPWGRVGLTFGLLMLCLGAAAWDTRLSGALRVTGPLTFAYNIRLLESQRFWPLFILGNLTLVHAIRTLQLPYISRLF